jgi:hypothetical protein
MPGTKSPKGESEDNNAIVVSRLKEMSIPNDRVNAQGWYPSPELAPYHDRRQWHYHQHTDTYNHNHNEGFLELYKQNQQTYNTEKAQLQSQAAVLTVEVTTLKNENATLSAQAEGSKKLASQWYTYSQTQEKQISALNDEVKRWKDAWMATYNPLLQQTGVTIS